MALFRQMSERIPRTIAHLARDDPRTCVGGVATFARNLELVFERVEFMTPKTLDLARLRRERMPLVCDNHWVLFVPARIPVIGFQHGVAMEKFRQTRGLTDLRLALRQKKAARRENVLWVACAEWIGRAFQALYGNGAKHIIYHQVDLSLFDGRLDNEGSRLVLHDARNPHKGSRLLAAMSKAFPDWDFQPLSCAPGEVPDRLRRGRAFLHLSRYEGNSMVCNEAMAQNLPCLFTQVGLLRDSGAPTEVRMLDPERAFRHRKWLEDQVRAFLDGLERQRYQPRAWVERNASLEVTRAAWQRVLRVFDQMPWYDAG